jgi:hypothetical protein
MREPGSNSRFGMYNSLQTGNLHAKEYIAKTMLYFPSKGFATISIHL